MEKLIEGPFKSSVRLPRIGRNGDRDDDEDEFEVWTVCCGGDFDPKTLLGKKLSFKGARKLEPDSSGRRWMTKADREGSDTIFVASGKDGRRFKTVETSGRVTVSRCVPGVDDVVGGGDEEEGVTPETAAAMSRPTGHRLDVEALPQRHGFFGRNYEEVLSASLLSSPAISENDSRKSRKTSRKRSEWVDDSSSNVSEKSSRVFPESSPSLLSKKSKKHLRRGEESEVSTEEERPSSLKVSKKSEKHRRYHEEDETEEQPQVMKSSKKSKNRHRAEEDEEEAEVERVESYRRSSKKSNNHAEEEDVAELPLVESSPRSSKKSKKRHHAEDEEDSEPLQVESSRRLSKKTKKRQREEEEEEEPEEVVPPQKKKKKT